MIDDSLESCRLLPTWAQTIIFIFFYGIVAFLPQIFYFFYYIVIGIQCVVIFLLANKFNVYRDISYLEYAIHKKIVWVSTKRDYKTKINKTIANTILLLLTGFIYTYLSDIKLLIVNSLFSLLFFLKVIFYVPLVSVKIECRDAMEYFMIIDKDAKVITEFYPHTIKSVRVLEGGIEVRTAKEFSLIPIDFLNEREQRRLMVFLTRIKYFPVN